MSKKQSLHELRAQIVTASGDFPLVLATALAELVAEHDALTEIPGRCLTRLRALRSEWCEHGQCAVGEPWRKSP